MAGTKIIGSSAKVLACSGAIVLVIILSASLARSEPAKTAHQYASEAEAEYNLGHFAESIPLFEKAYKINPAPILLFNLGQCHRHLGNNERALFFYRRYLDTAPKAQDRQDVEKRMADLERAIAEQAALKNRPPPDVRRDTASMPAGRQSPPANDAMVAGAPVSLTPTASGSDSASPIPAAPPPQPMPAAAVETTRTWKTPAGAALGLMGLGAMTWGLVWVGIDGRSTGTTTADGAQTSYKTRTPGWILAASGLVATIGGGVLIYQDGVRRSSLALGLAPSGLTLAGGF